MSQVHPCARTTPRTRAEINASPAGATALACRYNITVATARKWKGREDSQDRSHRPHTLNTTLTPAHDLLVLSCTVGNAFLLAFLRCESPEKGWRESALSNPIPCMSQWTHPFDFVPEANKFVMLSPADNGAVFDFVVPLDPTQTWQVTRQALRTGGALKSAYVAGKRWSYSPATRCFVWVASSTSPVVAYRPVGV